MSYAVPTVLGTVLFIVVICLALSNTVGRKYRKEFSDLYDNDYETPLRRHIGKSEFILSLRALESINIKRKLDDRAPLNRLGFQFAIATTPKEVCHNEADWIDYLVWYNRQHPVHESPTTAIRDGGIIIIMPDVRFNGQGMVMGGDPTGRACEGAVGATGSRS